MLPGVGAEIGNVCWRGWVSTRASDTSVLPLVPQQLPLPALQLAPACHRAGIHRYPMLLALLLFWGESEEAGEERSPARKRRRKSPACLDPWSTGEDGVRLAGRQAGGSAWDGAREEEYPVFMDPRGGTWSGPGPLGCASCSGSVVTPSHTSSAAATGKEREKG